VHFSLRAKSCPATLFNHGGRENRLGSYRMKLEMNRRKALGLSAATAVASGLILSKRWSRSEGLPPSHPDLHGASDHPQWHLKVGGPGSRPAVAPCCRCVRAAAVRLDERP
jgi:hypothetical protein